MEKIKTQGFTAKDEFNSAVSESLADAKNSIIHVVDVMVKEDKEGKVAAFFKAAPGKIAKFFKELPSNLVKLRKNFIPWVKSIKWKVVWDHVTTGILILLMCSPFLILGYLVIWFLNK